MFLTSLCKNYSHVRALQTYTLSFLLLFLLSCTAVVQNGQQQSSQLLAENSMMKKRLPLMERESDILKRENQQNRIKIQELESQNKQLGVDLASQREKYDSDIAVNKEQISSLEQTLQKNEQDNKVRIDALTAEKKALEEKMVRDIHALNDQIVVQKSTFNQEKEKLVQENGQKELSLAKKLGAANKKIADNDLEISSLKSSVGVMSGKLDKANGLSAELAKARDASNAELESIKAAGLKVRKEYLSQLQSIKTANADLNKKIAELSGDVSRQKHTDPSSAKP